MDYTHINLIINSLQTLAFLSEEEFTYKYSWKFMQMQKKNFKKKNNTDGSWKCLYFLCFSDSVKGRLCED